MRSFLFQTRRISSRSLPLPRLSSPSSTLPRRLKTTTSSSGPSATTSLPVEPSTSSLPPSLQPPPPLSSSQLPSTRRPPPPLHVRSSSPPTLSTPSTSTSTAPSPQAPSKSIWLTQVRIDDHRSKAVALAARLEAEGSEVLISTPELFEEVRKLFKKVPHLARASEDHLRALSIIHQACSTSPAALEDDGLGWIRKITYRLLFLFTRRLNNKSDSLLPSLRLVLQAGPVDLDLLLSPEAFRKLAVDLASGATNASEAVEVVEGLRKLSPPSFTDVEYEKLLQAIGRVEYWTTTTRDTFQLPSFPAPLPPLPEPSLPAAPPSLRLPTTFKPQSISSTPTTASTSSSPLTIKRPLLSPPSSSSRSNPSTPSSASSSSTNPPQAIYPASPPLRSNNNQIPLSPSPPSSSNSAQQQLLEFSRALSRAPPPSVEDLQYLQDLFHPAFSESHKVANRARIEVALHILTYASRTPPLPARDRNRFAGLVSVVLHSIENLPFVDLDSFGLNVRKDLLSLVGRSIKRGQVRSFAEFLYKNERRNFEAEELKTIIDARDRLPEDDRKIRAPVTYQDWEKGFGTRLREMMEDASSSDPLSTDTDAAWIEQSNQALRQHSLPRGAAYQLLESRSIQALSSSESLLVASSLYSRYAPPNQHAPFFWRQRGDAIVRMLLLLSNHRREVPSFKLLEPILRDLPLLPPSFIPSTPFLPSFAIPLLPTATNLNESLLIVNSILHAQELNPASLPKIWSTFLSSLERHSAVPPPERIFASQLFNLVQTQASSEEDRTGPTPLEDVVQMYLRRVERKEGEGAKRAELVGLEKLEKPVIEREEGKRVKEEVLGELRRVLEEGKGGEKV